MLSLVLFHVRVSIHTRQTAVIRTAFSGQCGDTEDNVEYRFILFLMIGSLWPSQAIPGTRTIVRSRRMYTLLYTLTAAGTLSKNAFQSPF